MVFYIFLPSDSSAAYYPGNTISEYVTKLPKQIALDEGYEVGVSEMSIPLSFFNVREDDMYMMEIMESDNTGTVEPQVRRSSIPPGRYNKDELIKVLCKTLPPLALTIKYNFSTKKVDLIVGRNNVYLSDALFNVLGGEFTPPVNSAEPIFEKNTTYTGVNMIDFNCQINRLYIYSDVVEHRVVGDSYSNLLITIDNPPVKSGDVFGHTLVKRYGDVRFLPVSKNILDTIAISIRDDQGRLIQFQNGKSMVELAFRKKHV